jgi:hypothetical protein
MRTVNARSVTTKYYVLKDYRNPVKINRASDVDRAVANAYLHMQHGDYGSVEQRLAASMAEVYDEESGLLYAIVKRDVKGDVRISFKDDTTKPARMAIGAFAEFL